MLKDTAQIGNKHEQKIVARNHPYKCKQGGAKKRLLSDYVANPHEAGRQVAFDTSTNEFLVHYFVL